LLIAILAMAVVAAIPMEWYSHNSDSDASRRNVKELGPCGARCRSTSLYRGHEFRIVPSPLAGSWWEREIAHCCPLQTCQDLASKP
jgi:hypothetical protein